VTHADISDEERGELISAFLAKELAAGAEPGWYYLSFASESGFLGGCYVQGVGMGTAVQRSHALGINPGGEVLTSGPFDDEHMDEYVPVEDRNRLLTREEVEAS